MDCGNCARCPEVEKACRVPDGRGPTTVFAVKDRVTGHNPVAALYTSRSYYRRLAPKRIAAPGERAE